MSVKFLNSNTALGGRVAVGVSALVGPTGPAGAFGGPQGLQGPIGSGGGGGGLQGPQGLVGSTGSVGLQGLVGSTGSVGLQGLVGSTGSIGLQGLVGSTGSIGLQGPAGSGGSGTSQWVSSTGGIIYYSSGSIGINKANPAGALDIVGVLNLSGNMNMITGALINSTIQNYKETVNLGTSSSASYVINCSTGNNFNVTLATATTAFSFINVPGTGTLENINLFLTQDNSGNRLATWPASVSWGNPSAPVLSTSGGSTDIISFSTFTGGSKWFGFLAGRGF